MRVGEGLVFFDVLDQNNENEIGLAGCVVALLHLRRGPHPTFKIVQNRQVFAFKCDFYNRGNALVQLARVKNRYFFADDTAVAQLSQPLVYSRRRQANRLADLVGGLTRIALDHFQNIDVKAVHDLFLTHFAIIGHFISILRRIQTFLDKSSVNFASSRSWVADLFQTRTSMFTDFDPSEMRHFSCAVQDGDIQDGDGYVSPISVSDFEQAITEITQWSGYAKMPLWQLNDLAKNLSLGSILYKDEGPRFGLGSFKALGGAYAALRVLQRELTARVGHPVALADIRRGNYADQVSEITLVSATDGNHGRSLAWGCQRFGAPCRIYIHADVSEGRAQAMRDLGATVVRISGDYDASVRLAKSEAEAHGWFVVSDTSWPGYSDPPRDVMAGYAVMTNEICTALDQPPSHVFLQGGVGGLAASVAAYFRQYWGESAPRVVIVEPELAACLFESARAGAPRAVQIEVETVMAGLSCGEPSPMAWPILNAEATDFVTIPDRVVGPTMRLLARPTGDDPGVEAGESAVAGLAALIMVAQDDGLRAKLEVSDKSTIVVIGSEGITDPQIYAEMMRG